MANSVEIINNGASLKIKTNGVPRDLIKAQIHEVTVLRGTIIKIDIGQGALFNVFIDQTLVINPPSSSVDDLREQILVMLAPATSGGNQTLTGFATESNQANEIAHISALQGQVSDLQTKLNSVDNKVFYQPSITDQNNPNMVYKGYALPGTDTRSPAWAIERVIYQDGLVISTWAGGNKNLDKVWDSRDKGIAYS